MLVKMRTHCSRNTPAEGTGIRRIEPQISALLFDESHRGPLAASEVSSEHQQWDASNGTLAIER